MEDNERFPHEESRKAFYAGYKAIRPLPDDSKIKSLLQLAHAFACLGFMKRKGCMEHTSFYQRKRQLVEDVLD